jgi:hypothetical protein
MVVFFEDWQSSCCKRIRQMLRNMIELAHHELIGAPLIQRLDFYIRQVFYNRAISRYGLPQW